MNSYVVTCGIAFGLAGLGVAQQSSNSNASIDENLINLSLPKEVEISLLLDLAKQHLGLNLLYDDSIRGKRISMLAQRSVTQDELRKLLETALAIKDLVLIPMEVDGWFRVAPTTDFLELSGAINQDSGGDGRPMTHVFKLANANPSDARAILEPFLTQPGGTLTIVPNTSTLILTDLPASLNRAKQLLDLLDQPEAERFQRIYSPQHIDATVLLAQLNQAHASQIDAGRGTLHTNPAHLYADSRNNRIFITGTEEELKTLFALAESLDTPDPLSTRRFVLTHTSPERFEKLLKNLFPTQNSGSSNAYQSTLDPEGNALIVRGNASFLEETELLRQQIDQPVDQVRRPIRFYKIRNTTASNILQTIQTITPDNDVAQIAISSGNTANPSGDTGVFERIPEGSDTPSISGIQSSVSGVEVTVGVDEDTNSIIVVGPPSAQDVYAELIERLDIRPPQVLIEVMLVTIDTSNGFELGVDISRVNDTGGAGKLMTFSSFGLSTIDAATGFLTPSLGIGFNGALLESDIADVVLRALKTDGRTRVEAAPSILINDGKVGTLTATSDQPTTSTSQGNTTDTTSFAGFVSAGTTVNITPRIAEGDHLALEYQVELSAFDGDGASGIPAPRQTNNISSDVTIPDGSTIVLGGLNRHDLQETVNRIPLLGEIPVLEHLFSSRKTEERDSTLFVFIKAQIMRDDDFRDLKTVSSMKREEAKVPDDFPASEPLLMN